MSAAEQYDYSDGFDMPVERLVPRIDIEAFCVTRELATSLQDAAEDRRMARTSIAVAMGGIRQAVATYEDMNTPHLLIVESDQEGMAMFDELESLAEVVDPDTKVIVCGPSNDVTLYRELKRQGVDEYVVTPTAPIQIIESVSGVYSDPEAAPLAKTVGFVGVKGGVGASVLSHNIAWMLGQAEQKEVILVDLDIPFGTVGFDFQHEPTRSVVDALGSMDELDDVKLGRLLIEHDDYLSLLAAPASLDVLPEIDEQVLTEMIHLLRETTDFAVFDIPHSWSAGIERAMTQMEQIVLVATPELASVRNLKTLNDVMLQRRQNDAPPKIVINGVGMPKRPEIAISDITDVIGREVDLVIPFDPTLFGTASNEGKMVKEVDPSHEAVTALQDLCGLIAAKDGVIRRRQASGGSLIDKLKGVKIGKFAAKIPSRKKNDTAGE